jgi:ubiquinone biosynthesis protein Coq4
MPGLLRDPFALDLGIEFLHGIIDTPMMRLAFRQMLIGLDSSERTFLESLTRTPIDLDAVASLPETTLGGAYSRFFATNDFDPKFHAKVYPNCLEDLERNWIFARFARLHDLHHVMLGIGVSRQEEIALHLLLFVNTRDPVAAAFMAGLPYLAPRYLKQRRIWTESRKLIRAARALPNLCHFPYEEVMAEPLVDLRARIGLPCGGCPTSW